MTDGHLRYLNLIPLCRIIRYCHVNIAQISINDQTNQNKHKSYNGILTGHFCGGFCFNDNTAEANASNKIMNFQL